MTKQNQEISEIQLAREKAGTVIRALEEKKAEALSVIDISKVSTLADYFIVATGGNQNQLRAMQDNVDEKLSRQGIEARHIEGSQSKAWILMDYGDVIVHLFDRDNRAFYDLERIWKDGEAVPVEALR